MIRYHIVFCALLLALHSAVSFGEELPQPLTLEECVRTAFASSPDVLAAQERIEQARAAVMQAQAGFYPRLSLGETFARTNYAPMVFTYSLAQGNLSGSFPTSPPPGFDPFGQFNNPPPLNDWNTQLLLQWPLFQGGRTFYGNRAAIARLRASEMQIQAVYNDLQFAVISAFFGILMADQSIGIAEESTRRIQEQLDIAQARYENEVALKSDVLRVAVSLAEAENQLAIARHNLERAKSQLNLVMGRAVDSHLELAAQESMPMPEAAAEVESMEQLIEAAKRQRPEIEAMQRNIVSLEQTVRTARAAYFPQVNAFAHYDIDTEDFSDTNDSWTIGVGANLSLFDGFLTRSAVQSARAQLREAQAQYERLLLQVEMDVKNAYLARSEALSRLSVLEQSVAEAEESQRIISDRYSEGMALVTDLLNSEVALTNVRLQTLSARYEYQVSSAALERATGGLAVERPEE
jgi:outer membrane protein TolC